MLAVYNDDRVFLNAMLQGSGLRRGRNRPQRAISCVVGAILWFTRFGGDFGFQGGRFLQVETYSNVELIPKNQYLLLWNQSLWCTFDSMVRNKAYKAHIGLVTHQSNYCNMVLWNTSLHQLFKTTEIVTGWESSIAVLTKIIGQPIFWPKNLKFWL